MIVNETGQVSTPASPFADMIRSAAEATGVNFNYLFQQVFSPVLHIRGVMELSLQTFHLKPCLRALLFEPLIHTAIWHRQILAR